jgi:hypothetical protein
MEFTIKKVPGPKVASVKQEDALEQLQNHPQFPKGAQLRSIKDYNGQWVAELKVPKVAAPPAFLDDEPPAAEDDTPFDEPKDESKDDESDDKSDDDKGDKGDKGDKVTLDSIMDLVKQIAATVGVPTDDSTDDLADELDDLVLDDLPELDGLPEPPKDTSTPPSKLEPTPIGAPAFASTSVPADHPWKDVIGKVATFTVNETTDATIVEAKRSLDELGQPFGYKAKQMVESQDDDGNRVLRALISRY